MRLLCLFLALMTSHCIYAQIYKSEQACPDTSVNGIFTKEEIAFLNAAYSLPSEIDFNEKNVCFLTGNSTPHSFITKEEFCNDHKGFGLLYIFNEEEKKEANGYDMAFTDYTKKWISEKEMPKYVRKAMKRNLKTDISIDRILIYKSFHKEGTTASVLHAFHNPNKNGVDATNSKSDTIFSKKRLSSILNKTKRSQHLQKKITDINIAGEFWTTTSSYKHYFVLCSENLFIDLTEKKEYLITNKTDLTQIELWTEKLKTPKGEKRVVNRTIRNYHEIPTDTINQLDKMGVDDSPLLNKYESAYFNVIFKDSLTNFDFTGKKIGFVRRGSKSDKKEFFDSEKGHDTPCTLHIFDETQKEESGGYDAAISYWCIFHIPKQVLVQRLKGKDSGNK